MNVDKIKSFLALSLMKWSLSPASHHFPISYTYAQVSWFDSLAIPEVLGTHLCPHTNSINFTYHQICESFIWDVHISFLVSERANSLWLRGTSCSMCHLSPGHEKVNNKPTHFPSNFPLMLVSSVRVARTNLRPKMFGPSLKASREATVLIESLSLTVAMWFDHCLRVSSC